jgi:hypothetical protein
MLLAAAWIQLRPRPSGRQMLSPVSRFFTVTGTSTGGTIQFISGNASLASQ